MNDLALKDRYAPGVEVYPTRADYPNAPAFVAGLAQHWQIPGLSGNMTDTYTYTFADVSDLQHPKVNTNTITIGQARSGVNLPGNPPAKLWVSAPTSAVQKSVLPGQAPQPISPMFLSTLAQAQQILALINNPAAQIGERTYDGGFYDSFPPGEDRRVYQIELEDEIANVGQLFAQSQGHPQEGTFSGLHWKAAAPVTQTPTGIVPIPIVLLDGEILVAPGTPFGQPMVRRVVPAQSNDPLVRIEAKLDALIAKIGA